MEKCPINKIGTCTGCSVQDLAKEKMVKVAPEKRGKVVNRISKELCPTGEIMQTPELPKQSIW